jgi:hypothetical protein
LFEGAQVASRTNTGEHGLGLNHQPQGSGLTGKHLDLVSCVVGLHTEEHGRQGDHTGDRQQPSEYPRVPPEHCRTLLLACGFEFRLLALLLGLDAVVFAGAGGVQVVAGGVQAVAEAGFGGQCFGLGQAGAFQ